MSIKTRPLLSSVFLLLTAVITINAQDPKYNEIEVRGTVAIPSGEASFASGGSRLDQWSTCVTGAKRIIIR